MKNMTPIIIQKIKEKKDMEQIENKRQESERIWKACCFELDRSIAFFFAQLIISLAMIVFCMWQLSRELTSDSRQMYSGFLSFVIGVWLPSPRPR